MISSDPELQQAVEQMQRLYQVLAGLRRKIEPDNAALFALMAEGPTDMLQELQEQVDAYVGLAGLHEQEGDPRIRAAEQHKFETARYKLRKSSRPRVEAKAA